MIREFNKMYSKQEKVELLRNSFVEGKVIRVLDINEKNKNNDAIEVSDFKSFMEDTIEKVDNFDIIDKKSETVVIIK